MQEWPIRDAWGVTHVPERVWELVGARKDEVRNAGCRCPSELDDLQHH